MSQIYPAFHNEKSLNRSMIKKTIVASFLFISIGVSYSQTNKIYRDLGVMAGPVFFQSDYGQRGDFENYIKQNGFSIGVFYYFMPNVDFRSIRENFKLRLETSYMKSQLQHYGKWVDGKDTPDKVKLRAMKGSVSTKNLGFQVEYYPFKTYDYCGYCTWNPYLSLGSQLNGYTTEIHSSLGELKTNMIDKYKNVYENDSNVTVSFTVGFGIRYKLTSKKSALIFDYRLQYYFTDWVDGLNPDKKIYPENKANDYSTTFNFGYVYYSE